MALPPGPRAPALVQTLQMFRDPIALLDKARDRYGDIYTVKFSGGERAVYVAEPDLAREAFATDKTIGRAGEARARFLEPLVGEHSLLTLDGEEWRRQRELLGPPLHGDRIERFAGGIAEIAGREAAGWRHGEEFALQPRMQAVTLEVILRVVFGIAEGERSARLSELLPRLIAEGERYAWAPPRLRDWLERDGNGPRRIPFNPARRVLPLRDEVDRLVYAEIAARRSDPDLADRDDVLSEMLRARDADGRPMSDAELRDELITLLTAGHETTATALAWTFDLLCHTPRTMERLTESLSAGEDEYLDAVVKESLRLRPVVFDVVRTLAEPLEIAGYVVPAGWYLAPGIVAIQRRTELWPMPDEFRPERFTDERAPLRAWLPFGGGRRYCVGAQLAMLELRIIVREILRRVSLTPAQPEREKVRVRHVTIQPSGGTRVLAGPTRVRSGDAQRSTETVSELTLP